MRDFEKIEYAIEHYQIDDGRRHEMKRKYIEKPRYPIYTGEAVINLMNEIWQRAKPYCDECYERNEGECAMRGTDKSKVCPLAYMADDMCESWPRLFAEAKEWAEENGLAVA